METILHNRRIFVITFLTAFLFWSSSFLPEFAPLLFSFESKLQYLYSFCAILLIIIIFGLISLLRFGIGKRRDASPSKASVVGVSLLFSVGMLTPVTIVVHRYIPRTLPIGSDTKSFNSAIWKSESSSDLNGGISVREQMLKEVVEKILPGKSRKEIERVLGPSLKTSYFKSLDKDLIYYLGIHLDWMAAVDSEWLLIWLDENGNFKRYRIVND